MKRKCSSLAKRFASGLVVLGVAVTGTAFASQTPENTVQGFDLGKGWLLSSSGGLSYVHPDCADYFFKLSGLLRFDEIGFMGSYRDKGSNFPSGGNLRTAEMYFDGGLGRDWEYTATLQFASSGRPTFGDTWLSYMGFADNNQAFVGRVSGNWFGLDNSNSGSWNPFMERSLVANTFYPGDGIGVMTDFWWDNGAITLVAMQSNQSTFNEVANVRDRWRATARATAAPVHEEGDVWHFGLSGAFREVVNTVSGVPATFANGTGAGFNVGGPGVTLRNSTGTGVGNIVSTVTANGGLPIRASSVRMYNVEAARQIGPFMLEAEYTTAFVNRTSFFVTNLGNQSALGSLRFSGWNIQTRYLLTGEHHAYDVRDGQFGSVKPCSSYGAFEVAARYDFVDLNNKNVRGGTQHDVTLGLNWFLNQQVRFTMNYIRASIHPANDAQKRNLDIIGLRAQVRFK
jgi:phosphate-selective porin OprO/OprP